MKRIDFLASQPQYLEHIAPIWNSLPERIRGTFYVPDDLTVFAQRHIRGIFFGYHRSAKAPFTVNLDYPVLVANYGDMIAMHEQFAARKILYMEHGIGHTFHKAAYPDGPGKRDFVSLFLPPNEYTLRKIKLVRPDYPCRVIGTPKTDRIVSSEGINPLRTIIRSHRDPPTIAIGFHWGTSKNNPPESGSALEHYKEFIPKLAKQYHLLAYGHPLIKDNGYQNLYERHGIEYVPDFWEVMQRADVLLNDLSSVMYEFLLTGKPVIVLNAPWFRRDVHHGIRFWDYSDIGINVEQPEDIPLAIQETLDNYYAIHLEQRNRAITDLYPYLGEASQRAVQVIMDYLEVL